MHVIPRSTLMLWKQINLHLDRQELGQALEILDKITSKKIPIEPENFKIQLIDAYVHIADSLATSVESLPQAKQLILKSIGLLKNYKPLLNGDEKLSLLYDSISAKSFQMLYQIKNQIKVIERGEKRYDFTKIENIYDINETIQNSITLFRSCVQLAKTPDEIYSNRNNLAVSLSRVGRFVECLINYEENIRLIKDRPQSNLSWADSLYNIKEKYNLINSASIWICIAERYLAGIKRVDIPVTIKNQTLYNLSQVELELNSIGFELTQEIIIRNRNEEQTDYKEHPELRKFSIEHQITLSEHALFCNCRDSRVDGLEIGNSNPKDEQVLATIISEFSFARYLLFKFINNITDEPDDFTKTLFNNSSIGYKIEHLKQSFKITYSILDKIANGIIDCLGFTRIDRHTYFEDIFGHYKPQLEPIKNISLCALYSLSLELNQNNGNLKYFKKLRNIIEHETQLNIFSDGEIEFSEEDKTISTETFKQLTLNLMKLTRSAIFSFVFLIRDVGNEGRLITIDDVGITPSS